jgi:hypothetical protein
MDDHESSEQVKYSRGQHPNSQKNLVPIKPGEVLRGNNIPGKGYSLVSRLKDKMTKPLETLGPEAPIGERIVVSLLEGALKREATSILAVLDRHEGPVNQSSSYQDNRAIYIVASSEEAKLLSEKILQGERTEPGE